MTSQKHEALVAHLQRKSHDGQLEWEESALGDAFEVALANYTIRIEVEGNDYKVSILDKEGRVIESFTDVDLDGRDSQETPYYRVMKEVYGMARRIAMGVDRVLNDILAELEKEDLPS